MGIRRSIWTESRDMTAGSVLSEGDFLEILGKVWDLAMESGGIEGKENDVEVLAGEQGTSGYPPKSNEI